MEQPFLNRFLIYQKERFPFIANGILSGVFTFSAISYSRISRGADGFIELSNYFACAFTTITLFFLLRIFDEFKDKDEDAQFRPTLPVPRGLISLRELFWVGVFTVVFQIIVNLIFFPKMLILYTIVIAFLLLMGKEFFVSQWLKKKPVMYIVSHMFIIPLVDIYASGTDWLLIDLKAPVGLLFFFGVSYMNGIVLEFGRKIRVPANEEHNTYSTIYGANKAVTIWILVLFVTLLLSIAAAIFAGYGRTGIVVLSLIFVACSIPGFIFIKHKTLKFSKMIELSSGLWTLLMYLTLGGFPMIIRLLS